MSFTIFSIKRDCLDSDYLAVEIASASECSFKVKIPKEGYAYIIKDLCRIAPVFMRLDADLMEAFDNAFRTKPSDSDILLVKRWVEMRELVDVDCGVIDYINPLLVEDGELI